MALPGVRWRGGARREPLPVRGPGAQANSILPTISAVGGSVAGIPVPVYIDQHGHGADWGGGVSSRPCRTGHAWRDILPSGEGVIRREVCGQCGAERVTIAGAATVGPATDATNAWACWPWPPEAAAGALRMPVWTDVPDHER